MQLPQLPPVRPDRATATLAVIAAVAVGALAVLARYPIVYGDVRAPLDIQPGAVAGLVSLLAPPLAAAAAALAILAPWSGFVAILALTPVWNAAQVGWWVGPLQVLLSTGFLGALWVGWALELRRTARGAGIGVAVGATARRHPAAWSVGLGLLALATASTLVSPSIPDSGPVWLHGVVEPIAFGLLVLAFGPDLRRLGLLAIALGLSAALGGLINLGQTLPTIGGLTDLQGHARELFSRLTYFNVGLFGEVLAMALPLLGGGLAARRALGLGRLGAMVVAAALALALACLYLTFSKSGWLASGVALLALLVALTPSVRRRVAMVAAAVAISVLVVPWPLVVLRPVAPGLADAYQGIVVAVQGAARAASWDPATTAGETSITERLLASRAALSMAADHPLLGVGLNRFGAEYAGAYRPAEATVELDSAHDLLPNLAAELGIPAALLTALAMATAVGCCWAVWRRASEPLARTLAASLGAALVGWWIVSATFDPDLYRVWRLMASDVVMAAVLVAMAAALVPAALGSGRDGQSRRPVDDASASEWGLQLHW